MNVIELVDVSKRYRRTTAGGPRTLRDLGLQNRVEHWALRNVSLTVRSGESVGLIGLNGSGKSTLLRVIARTTAPTTGTVHTSGVLGGLLALGTGLDASLSAAENAYTGAILAGVRRSDIDGLLPAIAEFAELEDVFHEPMRTFSDGMKLRLAFATAIHVDPQILLIDEVLAVGDAPFRDKCISRLHEMRSNGMTFVVVSHALSQVEQLCDRVVWLDHGTVRMAGPTADVLERYEHANASEEPERSRHQGERRFGSGSEVGLLAIDLVAASDRVVAIKSLRAGQPVSVRARLQPHADTKVQEVRVSVSIHRASDYNQPVDVSTVVQLRGPDPVDIVLRLDRLDLAAGDYWLNGGAFSPDWVTCHDFAWQATSFTVDGPEQAGPVVPPHTWTVESAHPDGSR